VRNLAAVRRTEQIGSTSPPDFEGGVLDPYEGRDLERGFVVADATVAGYLDFSDTEAEYGLFERVRFDGTPFSGAKLGGVRMVDVELDRSDTSNADFAGSRLTRVVFSNCRMTGVALAGAALEDVVFRGCKLNLGNLRTARLLQVTFEDCLLDDTDFNGSSIELSRFDRCDIQRCDFRGTRMRDVDLRGSEIVLSGKATDLAGAIVSPIQLQDLAHSLAADARICVW
jgi:uncharacterized protein YjbI with pentapeptide repeats